MIIKIFSIHHFLTVQDALFVLGYRFHNGSLNYSIEINNNFKTASLFVDVLKGTFRIRKDKEFNRDGLIKEAAYDEKTGHIRILDVPTDEYFSYLQPFKAMSNIKRSKKAKEYIYMVNNTSDAIYVHPNLLAAINNGCAPINIDPMCIINLHKLPLNINALKINGIYVKSEHALDGKHLDVFHFVPFPDFRFMPSPILNTGGNENNQIGYVAGNIDTSLSFLVGLYPDEFRSRIPESIEWMQGYIGGEYNSDTNNLMVRGHVLTSTPSQVVAFRLSFEI